MPNPYAPSPIDISASRQTWDSVILQYGDLALLRQPGLVDRLVSMLPAHFSAMERMGQVSNPNDRKVLLSVYDPSTGDLLDPEPSERDVLVTLNFSAGLPVMVGSEYSEKERLKLVAPPARVGPSDDMLYWRLQVRA